MKAQSNDLFVGADLIVHNAQITLDHRPSQQKVASLGSEGIGTPRRYLKHPRVLGIIFVSALAHFRLARVLVQTTAYTVEVSISPAKVS